jgi:DNA-binding NarL/FixJ family response regulator
MIMGKIRILLADDHAVVRAGIRKVVEELPGLEVVAEVGDGPSLFAALARALPDCLLIDVTMPDFEPIQAIGRIRAQYPSLNILVVSAFDDDIYVQGLLGAGVNGYHLKDQPLSDLQLAVQRVLAGELWISSPLISKLLHANGGSHSATTSVPSLTVRQQELLRLLQQGFDNQAIAQHTGLSIKTIENHLTRLYRQLHVQSRLEAANYIREHPEVLGVPGEAAALGPASHEGADNKTIHILVVDDNARYRRQLLRMIGIVCSQAMIYEAQNIGEAAHLAQNIAPQLALVDVVLGEEDGIRCTRRIKALSPLSRVVLISAYPDREFHRLGLEAGAVAFLDKKDLDVSTLRQVVQDVVS